MENLLQFGAIEKLIAVLRAPQDVDVLNNAILALGSCAGTGTPLLATCCFWLAVSPPWWLTLLALVVYLAIAENRERMRNLGAVEVLVDLLAYQNVDTQKASAWSLLRATSNGIRRLGCLQYWSIGVAGWRCCLDFPYSSKSLTVMLSACVCVLGW